LGRARYLDPAGFGGRVALCAVATVLLVLAGRIDDPARLQARGAPPWPAPAAAQVPAGVHAAGLALPAGQPDVVRFAVHLDVIVDGRRVTVPPGVGARGRLTAALYTSDSSGIIHIESDSDQSEFTLGQFFDEWQVALTRDQLGGLRASRHDLVEVYLDGSRVAGPPGSVLLAPHQEIAVTYRPGEVAVPAGYAFPAGT
jgi:hypothetical protein